MKTDPMDYSAYWGKAGKGARGQEIHLLPYHCLDVAAVGSVLLNQHDRRCRILARLLDLDEADFSRSIVFLLALHDLGKFAEGFQNLRPDLLKSLQGKTSRKGYELRHDTSGFLLWTERIRSLLEEEDILPQAPNSRRRRRETGYDVWMRTIAGHHGEPPKEEDGHLRDFFTQQDIEAAELFACDASALLLREGKGLPEINRGRVRRASWWLAGFAVLCDWLGSNTDFFPACGVPLPLSEYWLSALERAEQAVAATELIVGKPVQEQSLQVLFPEIEHPTPLQALCGAMTVDQGPQLCFLEDVTGAGKTEAAVLLAHRLMFHNGAAGLYFALPTMATANAMFERMQAVYRRLFSAEDQPSLVLAHSARNLSKDFRQSVLPESGEVEVAYGDGTVPASAHCSAWLGDHPKKALLAAVGVGTVDQALLGILPSRHQGLRLLGLMDKILIVDEVHACDAYMHALLKVLLRAQAASGGSAILLSATLPAHLRQALVEAYAQGWKDSIQGLSRAPCSVNETRQCEAAPAVLQKTGLTDFPMLTRYSPVGLEEISVETREDVRRYVKVDLLDREEAIERIIREAVEAESCVCWIRNTVADARRACVDLRRKYPSWTVDLFHSRFALSDRLDIEDRTVKAFGKQSRAEQRRGRVLIATQVVEQSLDVDFDAMVTDLAPMDLIIQRAGRLQRHNRDAFGNRNHGSDKRGPPVLYVLSPDPVEQPGRAWYETLFPRGSWVYPNHGQLWRTARLLKERGGFRVPEDVRELTEGVFSEESVIPEGLLEQTFKAEGKDLADTSVAALNALDLAEGYSAVSSNRWWNEATTPTRLGEPTTPVYLGRWDGLRLAPWAQEATQAWQRSAVQVRTFQLEKETAASASMQTAMEAVRDELPSSGKWGVLLPLAPHCETIWQGVALNGKGEKCSVYYSRELGLIMEEEMSHLNDGGAHEPD